MRLNTFFLTTLVSLTALNVSASPKTEITVYNQDLALIKKSQTMTLKKGINEIVFDEMARQLRPESIIVAGDNVRILEKTYDYASVNYLNLLNANIGKTVKTVRQNPTTGENIFETATLVAADGVNPVLQFPYGIETNFPGRVLFENIPLGLNSTPILKAQAEVNEDGAKKLQLAYLASGFSWNANYVAQIIDGTTLSLLGRMSLTNNSGSDYDDVTVNLIAGEINTVRSVALPRLMMAKSVHSLNTASLDTVKSAPVVGSPNEMNNFYIYHLPQNTALKDGQIKQVSFINAPKVTYVKENIVNSTLWFNKNKTYFKNLHPEMIFNFDNTAANGLGMPLPEGKISFYENDKTGALQFMGENTIHNKAEGEKSSLNLGRAFDIYANGKVDKMQKLNERKYKKIPNDYCITVEETYLFDVSYNVVNKSRYKANIVLKQPFPTTASIVKETMKGKEGDGNEYVWTFTIEPGTSQPLNVTVQNILEQRECN